MSGSGIQVQVAARRTPQGSIECDISCNGQQATVIFTGDEVITEVRETSVPGEESTRK